jgi:hypothetical protein
MTVRRHVVAVLLAVVTLLAVTFATVTAAPVAIGNPTLRVVGTDTGFAIYADGITNGGIASNGAISFDLYFRTGPTATLPITVASVAAGPAWLALSPCGFTPSFTPDLPGDGGAGTNGVIVNGACTSGNPANAVTGDNVPVVTVTLTSCAVTNVPIDLDSGDDAFGGAGNEVSDMFDRNSNERFVFADAALTDGLACAGPTAITLDQLDAQSTASAPMRVALYLALAAGLIAAGGLALSRLKNR